MAYTFYKVAIPAATRRDHAAAGGKGLTAARASIHPGRFLRVLAAKEPTGPKGELELHLSITVGPELGPAERRATDEQCREAMASLCPGGEFEEVSGEDGITRHFWRPAT